MITDTLLGILNTLVDWVISIRPVWVVHLPQFGRDLITFCMSFNAILPITETANCVALTVTAATAIMTIKWAIKLVDWIADVIP